jgi:hypothetical protein
MGAGGAGPSQAGQAGLRVKRVQTRARPGGDGPGGRTRAAGG